MVSRIVERLSKAVSRRGFLGRAASAGSALALGILGFDQPAKALTKLYCCNLCSSTLCENQICTGGWCWTCMYKDHPVGNCEIVDCVECYSGGPSDCYNTYCVGGGMCQHPCANVICSYAVPSGNPC
jgi:hypothetical protein